MDPFWAALADLVNDWGWLLILMFVLGGGPALTAILSGRRANTKLRAKVKATEAENKNLRELMQNTTLALSAGSGGSQQAGEVSALAEQARKALEDRSVLLELLSQVRASDRVWPQLPDELIKDISYALDTMRPPLRPEEKEKKKRR